MKKNKEWKEGLMLILSGIVIVVFLIASAYLFLPVCPVKSSLTLSIIIFNTLGIILLAFGLFKTSKQYFESIMPKHKKRKRRK